MWYKTDENKAKEGIHFLSMCIAKEGKRMQNKPLTFIAFGDGEERERLRFSLYNSSCFVATSM